MANRQIEQAQVDIDAALLLIQGGDLEPAQELLRFARAELDDALAILAGGGAKEPNDHQPIGDGSRARQHS
jgi:hypothetical protein